MQKLISIALIFIFFQAINAEPFLFNYTINPNNIWLGEQPLISVNCQDTNSTVSWVFSKITTPTLILPPINLTKITSDLYILQKNQISPYLDKLGTYSVDTYCFNNLGQSQNLVATFSISELQGNITSLNPNPTYVGDEIEVIFDLRKDGIPIIYDASFQVFLNNQLIQLKQQPPYAIGRGWVLKFDSPSAIGDYNLKVVANYERVSISREVKLSVKNPIEFDIVSIDKNEVIPFENVTLVIKALERGNRIQSSKDQFLLEINGVIVSQNDVQVSSSGPYINLAFKSPQISPGSYKLKIKFTYGNFSNETSVPFYYLLPVKGEMLNYDSKPIQTEFTFTSSSKTTKKIVTAPNGTYEGFIIPGKYNLEIKLPHSKITIPDLSISEFSNPIKHNYYENLDTGGIRASRVFFYEISFPEKGSLEMNYEKKYVSDEQNLGVYICSNWNFNEKGCNVEWEELDADIDTYNDLIKMGFKKDVAIAIGNKKSLTMEFSVDKKQYILGDFLVFDAIVKDNLGNPVSDVDVAISFRDFGINASKKSSEKGIISIKLPLPKAEGAHQLSIKGSKYPYETFEASTIVYVFKSKEVSIVGPDVIRLNMGENSTAEFLVVNTGQTDLENIKVSISGLPSDYYFVGSSLDSLKSGEEKKIKINLFVPKNSGEGVFSSKFIVDCDDLHKEHVFGVTILPIQETKNNQTSEIKKSMSGKIVLPTISLSKMDFLVFIPISLIAFSFAFLLKKKKKEIISRQEIREMFSLIKSEIRSKKK